MAEITVTPQRTLTLTLGPDDVCLVLRPGAQPLAQLQPSVAVYLSTPEANDKIGLATPVPTYMLALFNVARQFANSVEAVGQAACEYREWWLARYRQPPASSETAVKLLSETAAPAIVEHNLE